MYKRLKSDTLLVVSLRPGTCGTCRHANQGTTDFKEGIVFCQLADGGRAPDSVCDQQRMALPAPGPASTARTYFCYERFDGTNGTWRHLENTRVLACDADPEMRELLDAARPYIPPDV